MRGNRFVRIPVVLMLIGALLGLSQSAVANTAPTVQQCTGAWQSSSASSSCGQAQIHNVLADISVSGNDCKITVDCSTSTWGIHSNQTWSGSKDDMASLHNCNGNLHVGSC